MPGHRLEPHSDPVRCLLRMASWWTVVLILQIGALWQHTLATTCTASTKSTCAPTLQVSGTCTSSVCDCVSGFVPTRTGCRGTIIPKIDIIAVSGSDKYPGSGEVLAGGPITLRCNPDIGNGQYIWKKGTTPLSGTNRDYEILAAADENAGLYSCKIKFTADDFETAESTQVTVTVVANTAGQKFTKVPTVVGMPAKAIAGASIKLACSNLPSGQTLTFEWYIGTTKQTSETSQTFTTTAGTGQYSCKIVKEVGKLADFETAESPKVNSPAAVTTISGVFLSREDPANPPADPNGHRPDVPPVVSAEVGNALAVYCAINDTDIALGTVTYAWQKGTAAISGETSVSFSKASLQAGDAGSYTCSVTMGTPSQTYTSRAVQLNVENTVVQSVDIVAIPTTPILGGYVYLDCQVKTTDLRRVTYSWQKNSVALPNVTDRALQINELINSDATTYKCTATVGLDSNDDTATITVTALTSITPLVTCADSVFGIGNKYTLICGIAYTTPGLTYTWKEGTNTVSGQTSQTYEITVKATATSYTCAMTLGTATSQTSAAFNIDPKKLLAVNINVGTVPVSGAYSPVTGTSVTLTCVATMAAGASGTVTYSWTKDSTATGTGTSTLTFDAGTTTNGIYKCKATIGDENLESAALNVANSATVAKPQIVESPDTYDEGGSTSYSEGGNYVLTCTTASHTPSLIYAWTKGGNNVGNSRVYQITSAKKGATGDDGSYICSAKSGDSTAVASDPVTITIGDKGKPCLYVDDCDGDQYADVCENSRCVCATGYTLQGNTCSGQGIVTISMLLLVLCGVIKLIL